MTGLWRGETKRDFRKEANQALNDLSDSVVATIVEGETLHALLDTGSFCSFIHEKKAQHLNRKSRP